MGWCVCGEGGFIQRMESEETEREEMRASGRQRKHGGETCARLTMTAKISHWRPNMRQLTD